MSVKIRLKQLGSANRRTFRVVVVEEAKKRDGRVLEEVGFINPLVKPAQVLLKHELISEWIKKGAQPTLAVKKLLEDAP